MPVEFRCPHCGKLLRTPDNTRGKKGRCPHCKAINEIPAESQPQPSELPVPKELTLSPNVPPNASAPVPRPSPPPTQAAGPVARPSPRPSDSAALVELPTSLPAASKPSPDLLGLTPLPTEAPLPATLLAPAYFDPLAGGNYAGGNYGGYGGGGYAGGYNPYAAPNFAARQLPPDEPLDDSIRAGLPWEDRRRDGTLVATVKMVLLEPAFAFSTMRRTGGPGRPLMFAVFGNFLGGLITIMYWVVLLVVLLLLAGVANLPPDRLMWATLGLALNLLLAVVSLAIFGTIGTLLGALAHAGILHVALLVLQGARGTYEASLRVTCYAFGSLAFLSILNIVPCLSPIAILLMYFVVMIIGVKWTHEISYGKSAGATVITFVLYLVVVIPMGIALYFAFMLAVALLSTFARLNLGA